MVVVVEIWPLEKVGQLKYWTEAARRRAEEVVLVTSCSYSYRPVIVVVVVVVVILILILANDL